MISGYIPADPGRIRCLSEDLVCRTPYPQHSTSVYLHMVFPEEVTVHTRERGRPSHDEKSTRSLMSVGLDIAICLSCQGPGPGNGGEGIAFARTGFRVVLVVGVGSACLLIYICYRAVLHAYIYTHMRERDTI